MMVGMLHSSVMGGRARRRFCLATTAAALVAALATLAPVGLGEAGDTLRGVRVNPECTLQVPVLVVGGTPAGVAAAVTAARMGKAVVETEARPYLGGDLTGPMLNMLDMDFGPDGQHLAQGVFLEIYHRLGMTFDVEVAKRVFLEEVRQEPLVFLRLSERPVAVIVRGGSIVGVEFENTQRHVIETICAQRIVDATDDADIAAMAGVPYTLGREGSGIDRAMMSATLVFELGGVGWAQVLAAISGRETRHMIRGGVFHGNMWGFGPIMRMYRPTHPDVAIYDLNLGLQNDHSVLVNGLLVFGVDGTNPASVADGMRRARVELPHLVEFLRGMAPGFSQAFLIRTADYLYIRETRHIRGLYTLTAQDIVDGRVFWDAIGVANYPIDLHPYRPGELNPFAPRRYAYTIPFRSLVPVGIANLVVASRSISASYEAAGSARVVPTTMEEGQAAGAAAVLSIREKLSFRQLAERPAVVRDLQGMLHTQGAYLPPEMLVTIGQTTPPWPAPGQPKAPGGAAQSPSPGGPGSGLR